MSETTTPHRFLGTELGNLKLTRLLGSGGMGAVFLAEHGALGTTYAVKILHGNLSRDPVVAERFRREAVACSQLRHANIVFVTDFGMHEEMGLFLVMEHLEGEDLATVITPRPQMRVWRTLQIASQICGALETAHSHGIVHRDLKPENIFLIKERSGGERVKLLDFGLAQIRQPAKQQSAKLTQKGVAIGTPFYMSPEQVYGQSERVTARSDLYALGAIIHEMLTAYPVFEADTPFEIMTKHLRENPKPLGFYREELEGSKLEAFVLQCLEKNPDHRPSSAQEAEELLQYALRELQDKGLEEAFEPGGLSVRSTTDRFSRSFNTRLRNLVEGVEGLAPSSALWSVLSRVGEIEELPESTVSLMSWGALMRDLLDPDVDAPGYHASLESMVVFVRYALLAAEEAEGAEGPKIQGYTTRFLSDALRLSDADRQNAMVSALQPLLSHPRFPNEVIPEWAAPTIKGSWSSGIKGFLNTPVSELFRRGEAAESARKEPEIEAPALPEEQREGAASLSDKLRGEVSMDSIKSVLGHEIRLFKRKK